MERTLCRTMRTALGKRSEHPASVAPSTCSRITHVKPSWEPCFAPNASPGHEDGPWQAFGATRESSPSKVPTAAHFMRLHASQWSQCLATNASPSHEGGSGQAFRVTSRCGLQSRSPRPAQSSLAVGPGWFERTGTPSRNFSRVRFSPSPGDLWLLARHSV